MSLYESSLHTTLVVRLLRFKRFSTVSYHIRSDLGFLRLSKEELSFLTLNYYLFNLFTKRCQVVIDSDILKSISYKYLKSYNVFTPIYIQLRSLILVRHLTALYFYKD